MSRRASIRNVMRLVLAIVALTATAGRAAAQPAWHVDVGAAALVEAWDHNGGTEWLTGAAGGLDRRLGHGVAFRTELVAVRVRQDGADAWLRGMTVGTRLRWRGRAYMPFVDVAVGLSKATLPVPPRGTRFNYLALAGGGLEVPVHRVVVSVTGRWFHASNNGREGRHLNPDIQALGVLVGVGWEF